MKMKGNYSRIALLAVVGLGMAHLRSRHLLRYPQCRDREHLPSRKAMRLLRGSQHGALRAELRGRETSLCFWIELPKPRISWTIRKRPESTREEM